MEFIKNYAGNDVLRKSFNQLAVKTFELDFEDWYQNGYWGEHYIPYSILSENKIIANVSVNVMDFIFNGEEKHYIQLGTVMTEEGYRNRGLIRRLINEIEKDYADKTDGFYLFANDSVLNFYPKFGYEKAVEYQYRKEVRVQEPKSVIQIPMKDKNDWRILEKAIKSSVPNSRFEMADNIGLVMFYITKFMQENVYYSNQHDAYIIAEVEDDKLFIHNIFAKEKVELNEIINAFGKNIKCVILGFTPFDEQTYSVQEVKEKETTLFVKNIDDFKNLKLMFPTLSHA